MNHQNESGFTLIELIIVIVIVGILSAVAYTSYAQYVRKANRSDATIALTSIAQRQERYFTENLGYATDFGALFSTVNGSPTTVYIDGSDGNYTSTEHGQDYKLDLVNATTTAFTLTATANSVRQRKDAECRQFFLQQTGAQKAKDASGNETTRKCWGG